MESGSGYYFKMDETKLKIQVHHIGGIGDCGPAEQMTMLKDDVKWTFYDASEESLEKCNIENKDATLINKAIGGENNKVKFNIMKNKSASSVLMPAKSAEEYAIPGTDISWGEHTEIIGTEEIELNKLDTLIEKGEISKPDFLSIDVQGTELEVIKGIQENLKDVQGLVCEVEFSQLYEGQALFPEIFNKMKDNGFRFCAFYNMQYFPSHTFAKQVRGFGFLTVAEALFLREPKFDDLTADKIVKLFKLCAIAICFNQRDWAHYILEIMRLKGVNIWDCDKENKFFYMNKLKEAYRIHTWNI